VSEPLEKKPRFVGDASRWAWACWAGVGSLEKSERLRELSVAGSVCPWRESAGCWLVERLAKRGMVGWIKVELGRY